VAGSFNKVILIGNLTRDPEIRYVNSGSPVTKFTIAVNGFKPDDEATFVQCVAWERLAETCNTYLGKGKKCLVEGRLSIRKYTDKEGAEKWSTEVILNSMVMLSFKDDGGGGSSGGGMPSGVTGDDLDEEIPF
jgi:single-strand DNA-binding protein